MEHLGPLPMRSRQWEDSNFKERIVILSTVSDRMPWDRATAALPDRK
jgi:hypothetical protein